MTDKTTTTEWAALAGSIIKIQTILTEFQNTPNKTDAAYDMAEELSDQLDEIVDIIEENQEDLSTATEGDRQTLQKLLEETAP